MVVEVRDTQKSDLPAIFEIRQDPKVAVSQYRMNSLDTVDLWADNLFGDKGDAEVQYRCSTILMREKIIGHVIQLHYETDGQLACYCGWDLAPLYWGRGIMAGALGGLFEEFFEQEKIDVVIADCFSDNRRCLRLLQKLRFQPMRMSLRERLRVLLSTGCLKWIRRFSLSRQQWQKSPARRSSVVEESPNG